VFNSAPGGPLTNPIHDNAFASLAALEVPFLPRAAHPQADYVRYVPWFPYPHVSVAELNAPVPGKPTAWNFTYVNPQLEVHCFIPCSHEQDFMEATHLKNHSTVINFSTQPCWLYNAADCSYPSNPDQSDFGYVRGNKCVLRFAHLISKCEYVISICSTCLCVTLSVTLMSQAAGPLCCRSGQVLWAPSLLAHERELHRREWRCAHGRSDLDRFQLSFSFFFLFTLMALMGSGPAYSNMTYWEVCDVCYNVNVRSSTRPSTGLYERSVICSHVESHGVFVLLRV
jgi:hypothetical protein